MGNGDEGLIFSDDDDDKELLVVEAGGELFDVGNTEIDDSAE